MAKKPLPPRRSANAAAPGAAPGKPQKSEAETKFDKFGAFALALPCTILAIAALVMAVAYTHRSFDIGFFGFPKKSIVSWESGPEAVNRLGSKAMVTSFESTNYIGRLSDGEVDVAVLNVGRNHNVNLGDVFTPKNVPEGVRLEFVVFDVQGDSSRAYILLGQTVADGKRAHSLKASSIRALCGAGDSVEVEVDRAWRDQQIRRGVETRTSAQ